MTDARPQLDKDEQIARLELLLLDARKREQDWKFEPWKLYVAAGVSVSAMLVAMTAVITMVHSWK